MLLAVLRREPALVWTTGLMSLAGLLVQFVPYFHARAAATAVIATALGHILTGAMAKPLRVTALTGAAGTILAALAAFGLHLPANWLATGLVGGGMVAGHLLWVKLSPRYAAVGAHDT